MLWSTVSSQQTLKRRSVDKDISRVAVERAAHTIARVKQSVRDTVPYGPTKVKYTPGELRKALQSARPGALQQIMQYLGPEQAMQLLLGARRNVPPTLEQFIEENNAN